MGAAGEIGYPGFFTSCTRDARFVTGYLAA